MTIRIRHIFYLVLLICIVLLNVVSINEVLYKTTNGFGAICLIVECYLFIGWLFWALICNWNNIVDFFDKPVIKIKQKQKSEILNLVNLAETPEEREMLISIEKRLNK